MQVCVPSIALVTWWSGSNWGESKKLNGRRGVSGESKETLDSKPDDFERKKNRSSWLVRRCHVYRQIYQTYSNDSNKSMDEFFSNRARFIRIELKGIHSLEVWAKSLISLYIPFSRIVIVSSTTCFYGFAWESNKAWAMLILWGLIQIFLEHPFFIWEFPPPPVPSPLQSGPQHLYRRDTMHAVYFVCNVFHSAATNCTLKPCSLEIYFCYLQDFGRRARLDYGFFLAFWGLGE